MTKFKRIVGLSGLVGLLAVAALTVSAAPSGATLVCPPGVTNPKYCSNVPPSASTYPATHVTANSAQLNGVVGPNVQNGDKTTYYFQYGQTTSYGQTTPPGTVGSCPPGEYGTNYCKSNPTYPVSYVVHGLLSCTTYHYRVVATNPDGTVAGGDQQFTTAFAPPIQYVKSPRSAKRSQRRHKRYFTVTVGLSQTTNLSVTLSRTFRSHHGHRRRDFTVVYERFSRRNASGTVKVHFQSPFNVGTYQINVEAKMSCGSEKIVKNIKIKRH